MIVRELKAKELIIEVLVAQGFNYQTPGGKWLLESR
jgi:hypothetical protein